MRARDVVCVLLGLAGFLTASTGVRAMVPDPAGVASTPKLDYFRRHASEYDAVFLGSSRVFRHVVPEVVDARASELGHPLRSFNFGVPGAGAFEVEHLLDRILALEGTNLRWVFVEPSPFSPRVFEENRETERTVAWHTPRGTRRVLAACWRRPLPTRERVELTQLHVRLFGWWISSLGQGRRILRALERDPELAEVAEAFGRRAGYRPLELETSDEYALRRRKLLADPEGFREKVARLPVGRRSRGGRAEDPDAGAIASRVERLRAAGIEPVHLIPPGTIATQVPYAQARRGTLAPLFAFNDPSRFPDLFVLERFFDRNHLDAAGAERFSVLFAEHWAAWRSGDAPPSLIAPDRP